jgi:hypothetical protein
MKKILLISVSLIFFNLSCEKNPLKYEANQIQISMNIENSKKIISLGETIVCTITLPDTFLVENTKTQTTSMELLRKINIDDPRRQAHLSCNISFLDTVKGTSNYRDNSIIGYQLLSGSMVHLPDAPGGAIGFPIQKPHKIEFSIQPK